VTWTISATAAAEADLAEAIGWYEDQTPGLGARLLDEVNGLTRRIADNPRQFPMVYGDARKASLRGFPYVLIFRLRGDEARLLAFFHTSRDPSRWQARVRSRRR
jgi:plasmid stabilization system protein ParE